MKKLSQFLAFFVISLTILQAQNSIDINAAKSTNLQAQESNSHIVREAFKEADRYRQFHYNEQLANLRSNNIGDTLWLNFFEDKQYKSIIQHVSVNFGGRTTITSQIVDHNFAYCYMVVSEKTITISSELPLENEYFFASVKDGQAYLGQMRKSELDKKALEGTEVTIDVPNQKYKDRKFDTGKRGVDDPEIIDLLIVYTEAAEEWAFESELVTDIDDLIDIALLKSNTVMENSETGITFNIVFRHKTDYVETDSDADLYYITFPDYGYMPEVHDLRNEYYADLIVFLPIATWTGGVAWLLNSPYGDPDFGVSLTRVQQASWTFTVVHEIGHNMGCHHHAEQNYQPGPGLFAYSSGWRGTTDPPHNTFFSTVMTYEAGAYFSDGITRSRIPYFSSPDIIFEEVPLGTTFADNARTLKRTKTPVANYRVAPKFYTVTLPEVTGATIELYGGAASPVLHGGDFSFKVILDPDYNQSEIIVKANDITVNPLLGVYKILNITEDKVVTIEGLQLNKIGENELNNVKVHSYQNFIYIKNESNIALKSVEITDMMGRVVYQSAVTDVETVITLQVANGIYNVKLISKEDNITVTKVSIIK